MTQRRRARFCFSILVALVSAHAQDTYGRITGRVMDSVGAVVPGARIQAVRTDTNVVTYTTSNSEGNFELLNLVPGPYRLTAELAGFKRYEQGPLEVRVLDVLNIPVTLELGTRAESVTVTADAPLLESAASGLSQVIGAQSILDLPAPGGAVTYLMQLVPTVITLSATNQTWGPEARDIVSNFSASGARNGTSQFMLDGIPNLRLEANNTMAFVPPPEAVQEMRVQTSAFDASVGHFTGANVNMVLRSGTNAVHGNLFFSYCGRPLMTKPFFTNRALYDLSTGPPTKEKSDLLWPYLRNNRYRGTVGGPVLIPRVYNGRSRTFWQFTFDVLDRKWPDTAISTVPTVKERSGDFSKLLALGPQYQIYDPATIAPAAGGRFSRQPFAGNIIPPSRLDPGVQKLLHFYPLPNATGTIDGRNNRAGAPANSLAYNSEIARIDQVIGPNHHIYGSASIMNQDEVLGQALGGIALGTHYYPWAYRGLSLDDAITLRPDLVLNLRYGLTRFRTITSPLSIGFDLNSLGISPALIGQLDPRLTTLPQIQIDQFTAIGSGSPTHTGETSHLLSGSVMHIRGTHSLRLGSEFRGLLDNQYNYGNVSPAYQFASLWTRGPLDTSAAAPLGQGLAAFLLGLPTAGSIDRNDSLARVSKYLAVFVHDDWKATRKLTLNIGLRYEFEFPTTERYDRANRGFDFTTPNPIQAEAQANYARNPIPEIAPSDFRTLGGLLFAGVQGVPRALWEPAAHNFSPRVGLAWMFRPKMVARAGYGIFFDPLGNKNNILQQGFSQQTAMTPSLDNGQTFHATFQNPFPDGVLQPPGASGGMKTFLGLAPSFLTPGRHNAYMQRWSLDIQRELSHRVLLQIGYAGTRCTGLDLTQDYNPVPASYLSRSPFRDQATINYLGAAVANPFAGMPEFAGNAQGATVARSQLLRPYPQFGSITSVVGAGFSWYHALYLHAEKRFSHGYTFQASYTWSKFMEAIDKLNPTDPGPHHVISPQDRPQHLAAAGTYECPFGGGKHWLSGSSWVNQVVGGWSLQAMYQAQSGPPLEFGNVAFYGLLHDIVLPRDQRTVERWFNTDAGFERASGRQLGSNIRTFPERLTGERAGGINTWDISLFKNIVIRERVKMQLRAEGQDALNHAMFQPPNTVPTNTLFGQVTNTAFNEQRKITLGARLMW